MELYKIHSHDEILQVIKALGTYDVSGLYHPHWECIYTLHDIYKKLSNFSCYNSSKTLRVIIYSRCQGFVIQLLIFYALWLILIQEYLFSLVLFGL